MQSQISPRTMAIIIGVIVIVILGIGYKMFFTTPVVQPPKFSKSERYKAYPTGGEAYHNPQGLGLPPQSGSPGR